MVVGLGYLGVMGIGEESVWGTEVACTARVPLISTTIDDVQTLNRSVTLEGRAVERPPDAGVITVAGDVQAQLRYSLNNLLLKHLLGMLTSAQYTIKNSREGMGLTLAIDKQVSRWGISGVKLSQVVVTSALDRVHLAATVMGKLITRPSTTNTLAVLQALVNSDANLLHRHLVFWLGDQVDALASGDAVHPTALTLTMARPVDTMHTDSQTIDEPLDSGFPTFTLAIPIPRHTTDQYNTWEAANTPLQARAYWTNGVHSLEILLPSLNVQTAPIPTPGPGVLNTTVTLHASESNKVYSAGTISGAAGDNSINDSANAFPYCYAGATIAVSGFTGAGVVANNKTGKVVSRTASKIVISGFILVDDAAGESVTIRLIDEMILVNET